MHLSDYKEGNPVFHNSNTCSKNSILHAKIMFYENALIKSSIPHKHSVM